MRVATGAFIEPLPWLSLSNPVFGSRDDKRYTEKKNKSERARRKKEDTAKLRMLVDLTLRYTSPLLVSPSLTTFQSALTPASN